MKLYNYWRSSASWRVRTALALKGLSYEYVPVHIAQGEQRSAEHHARNPMDQVPALELEVNGERVVVSQSIAIIELLDELHPEPALLPRDPYLRCRARELAEIVNSGIQPHQNLAPMARMDALQAGAGRAHARHFNELGLAAYEARAKDVAGRFSVGDSPTIADLCLVPQLNAARRFEVPDLEARFPLLIRVEAACLALPAFQQAHPDAQQDAVKPV
ncbi:maleylacetoacetate isomerase [Sandaracinus amylolyticus]|uniref:Maleylacetoacetate isomerase n=1 Tax=Sandaracinus amylolyticus TaxID=927083 RepID=A0A0F6W5T7_9BACT|nr:maleylacetoacetate isomerase [Sandaracinus amylolyticus]AKF08015.1 Maleylacetoacetate isomerase [Sandaracinus amylolyticus]